MKRALLGSTIHYAKIILKPWPSLIIPGLCLWMWFGLDHAYQRVQADAQPIDAPWCHDRPPASVSDEDCRVTALPTSVPANVIYPYAEEIPEFGFPM